jgi:hypothetical protein
MTQLTDQVAANIHTLVNDEGLFGMAHNDHLHQISDLLKHLSPAEADQVLSKLGSDDLKKWASEVNGSGIFGAQGLSQGEKKDLFNLFARDLDGAQLARESSSFGDRDDVICLSQSVAQNATADAKVQYIQQLAGQTPGNASDTQSGLLSQTVFYSNAQAIAVGNVLASLKGNAQAIDRAVASLGGPQLQTVVRAAESQTSTHYTFDISESPPLINTDARPLQAILAAVATGNDAATKARMFEAGAKALTDIQNTNQLTMPNIQAAGDAKLVEQGLTDILNSDTTGVVRALKVDQWSGKALTTYMKEMFTEDPSGSNRTIGAMIARLQQSNNLNQNPLDYVDQSVSDGHGQQVFINAENLGYFSGAVQAGIAKIINDEKTQGDVLNNVFTTAVSLGTGWKIPDPAAVPLKMGATVVNGGIREVIREVVADVTAGNKTLQDAMFQLSVPRSADGKAAELGADPSFNSTRSTVIEQNQ